MKNVTGIRRFTAAYLPRTCRNAALARSAIWGSSTYFALQSFTGMANTISV